MAKLPPWSYSSLKLFDQCPKKYYHLRVVKDVKDSLTEAITYGTEMHKAAEERIKNGTPIPPAFKYMEPAVESLEKFPGRRLCEYKMGVRRDFSPCGFFDKDVWWRGVADLIIIDDEAGTARVVDYKTGKNTKYADKGQLELMALAVFAHFPQVKTVKAGLLFVVCKEFIKDQYTTEQAEEMWDKWVQSYDRLLMAHDAGVWNPSPSGLCRRHCPVLECHHNGMNR